MKSGLALCSDSIPLQWAVYRHVVNLTNEGDTVENLLLNYKANIKTLLS